MKLPARPPAAPTPPTGKPDEDKLLRAVQDALAPLERGHIKRFRLLADDCVVVDGRAVKTYPGEYAWHEQALPEPGLWLRVTPAAVTPPPLSALHPGVHL